MQLYQIEEFSTEEKARIAELAVTSAKMGQDKKLNKNPMSRKICQVLEEMLNECMIRVAEERDV